MTKPGFDSEALLAVIRGRLPDLLGVWLFGSRARGTARTDSDIDVAVLGRRPYDTVLVFETGLELSATALLDVDLLDLRDTSVVFRKQVAEHGKLLWTSDREACDAFSADSCVLYVAQVEEQRALERELAREQRRV
ncbi:MAG: nucleotidyltransferase domain-containing protein [Planctomycetes bacterium]|nr:nucleotidyltransferase domain-containing protein [Planctomycetota bacterium]